MLDGLRWNAGVNDAAIGLLGVALGVIGTLFASVLTYRRERSNWLREERHKAYAEMHAAVSAFLWAVASARREPDSGLVDALAVGGVLAAVRERLLVAEGRALMLASEGTARVLDDLGHAINRLFESLAEPKTPDEIQAAADTLHERRDKFEARARKDTRR